MKCKYADFQFLLINMVIIIVSPKPVIVSRASETHCGSAKIDFGWPDWPAREKVKHDPWCYSTLSPTCADRQTTQILFCCQGGQKKQVFS